MAGMTGVEDADEEYRKEFVPVDKEESFEDEVIAADEKDSYSESDGLLLAGTKAISNSS